MFSRTWTKKCISALITTALVISSGISAFAAPSGGSAAKLIFSGITMQSNGDSVQGFLNIKVRNVENNGIDFTLEYNTDYVQLSDVENNSEDAVSGGPILSLLQKPNFFRFNETVLDWDDATVQGNLDKANGKYGELEFAVYLNEDAETSRYIGVKNPNSLNTQPAKILLAGDTELTIGGLSFNIKNPAEFAKLTSAELSKVFRVKETSEGASIYEISYVDVTTYPHFLFYDQSQYLGYEFEVENPIESVELNTPSMTVTAAEIFYYDSEADILRWLNLHMKDVTISYADGTEIADTINWGEDGSGYTVTGAYDVKGGNYTITQRYNEDFTVSARLTVEPVSVTGYYVDNDLDPINYTTDEVPSDISDAAMKLPAKAHPIFDRAIAGAGSYAVNVKSGWTITNAPLTDGGSQSDFFTDKTDGKYIFSSEPDTAGLPRWATTAADTKVDVTRGINLKQTEEPGSGETDPDHPEKGDTGITAVVNDDGIMTITVSKVGDLAPLPDTMDFIVRMPNGEVIDPGVVTGAGGQFDITLNDPDAGKATIVIKPGTDDASTGGSQERLKQYINLGSRGGMFGLAAEDSADELQSKFVPFAPDPRNNYYTGQGGSTNYTFDYSGVKSSLFSFDASMTVPPTTITLAAGDKVNTTYSGETGGEPGSLGIIKVTSWAAAPGSVITPGAVVTFTGTLADTAYTNYGRVTNPDGITVTLRVSVTEAPADDTEKEQIEDVEDFVFNKKRVGYATNELTPHEFTVTNIGNVDILGISVNIDSDKFIINGTPPYLLAQGESSDFTIIPKTGLTPGTYTAEVTIGSNKTSVLDTFTVTFKVTEGIVYDIELTVNDADMGSAAAKDGYSYEADETVTISAIANEDYEFANWQVINGDITLTFTPDASTSTAAFVMPDMENYEGDTVRIMANFRETPMARLRLTDLKELENDGTDTENNLLDSSFKKVAFSETKREYFVVTGSGSEENKAYFKVKDPSLEGLQVEVEVATKAGITGTTGTAVTLSADERSGEAGTYDVEPFSLESVPTVQVITIKLTAGEASRTYTLNVLRKLPSSELIDFGYGNSPYGLIMKDDVTWQDEFSMYKDLPDGRERWQQAAKDSFEINNSFSGSMFTPEGGHEGLVYNADAWGTGSTVNNYDKDDSALFVYGGDTFKDPGISTLTDSLGQEIDVSRVKRQLTLQLLTAESPASLTADLREITERTYALGSDFDKEETMIRDNRVRPGIYTIEYSFKDFDGNTVTVGRPLIVLYGRGDLDLSGQVDDTDKNLILNRFITKLPYGNLQGYEVGSQICLYRICDVNTDRNINNGDVKYIRNHSDMTQFYK